MLRKLTSILRYRPHKRTHSYLIWLCLLAAIVLVIYLLAHKETECDYTMERSFSDIPLLLNASNCKIPDINVQEFCVSPLIKRVNFLEDCFNNYYHWTYVDRKTIVINTTAIEESGYTVEFLEFCYKIVSRKMQEENNYDADADNLVQYSSNCFPMDQVTQPKTGEFFMVVGKEISWRGSIHYPYQNYHWIPSVENSKEAISKYTYWNDKSSHTVSETPPNVILIGIDSTSRLNFRRQMLKTTTTLEQLGAVEMLGYTKAGDNTFPNFVPMLSGYCVDDLAKICQVTPWYSKQDDCPYIWKRFAQANYFTALIEDGPFFTGFNYKKTGFVKQPVDFYLRPLMLAAHEFAPTILNTLNLEKVCSLCFKINQFPIFMLHVHTKYQVDHIDCVGHKTNDETIVDSIKQMIELSTMSKVPLYLHSWSTVLAHDDLNYISLVDDIYSDLLEHLNTTQQLKNTILFFLSDHGYRFGKIRETFSGWYEEKLPVLWMFLSPDLREKFPEWHKNLQTNSRRLVSTYHLYWTMNQILKDFSQLGTPENERDNTSGIVIHRRYQNSLLNPVPEDWTCDDVGVSAMFCACYPRKSVDIQSEILRDASLVTLSYVNSFLPLELCAELKLEKILSGYIMDKNDLVTFVISLVSNPGEFVLEAYVDYNVRSKTFGNSSTATVQRTSKINSDVSCVNSPRLELFCYCK